MNGRKPSLHGESNLNKVEGSLCGSEDPRQSKTNKNSKEVEVSLCGSEDPKQSKTNKNSKDGACTHTNKNKQTPLSQNKTNKQNPRNL